MSEVLKLLKKKTFFLTEFRRINEHELQNFANGHFEGLDHFYLNRERLLEIIQTIDSDLSILSQSEVSVAPPSTVRNQVSEQQEQIARLAKTIVQQDLDLLTLMEDARTKIIQELQTISKNKKGFSSYKTKVEHRQFDEEV
jgi:hypothetical protein